MPVGTFVNPEIIMGYKSPDLSGLDPSRMMQNVLAYKQAKTQQQANELALQQSQQKIADQNLMQEAYNAQDPVNYLRGLGRVDLADAYKTKQAEAQTADLERKTKEAEFNEKVAKADKTKVDTALQTVKDRFAGVLARHADNLNSEDALKDYLSISQQAHMDANLGPILGASGAHHAATVLQGQTALENGTLADLIQNSAMSADQLRESIKAKAEAAAPKPTQVDVGGAIKTIDMNPNSPTFKKELLSFTKTATPGQVMTNERLTSNLNRTALNLTPDQSDALTTAIAEGRLDPSKVNSRNASILAGVALKNRNADFNQLIGNAAMLRNVAYQQKAQMALALPTVLTNLEASGKKLNYSDNKWVAGLEAWGKGVNQDPQLIDYMTQRNDAILSIAAVARGVGMSDFATKLENEISSPHMSPKALQSYIAAQRKSLEPRLAEYRAHSLTSGTTPPPADNKKETETPKKSLDDIFKKKTP